MSKTFKQAWETGDDFAPMYSKKRSKSKRSKISKSKSKSKRSNISKSKSKSRTHMVKVNVTGFGVVEIDSGEYKGEKESDIHDFLKKIFQKIKPGSSYENSFKGKFSLSTRDGIQLSERINTRGLDNLSPKEIKGIIRKSNYLNLVYAPLSLRPKKTPEIIELEKTIAKLEEKSNNSKAITQAKNKIKDILNKQSAFVAGRVQITKGGKSKRSKRSKRSKKKRRTKRKKR